jgi:hypothetical protein
MGAVIRAIRSISIGQGAEDEAAPPHPAVPLIELDLGADVKN